MSRIGKLPIPVPTGVDVTIEGRDVTVQGPLRALHGDLAPVDVDLYPAGDGHGEPPDP